VKRKQIGSGSEEKEVVRLIDAAVRFHGDE
jgi:hypothetical protein